MPEIRKIVPANICLKFAKMFADPRRIVILVKWHEWRLSTDPTSESEMLDMEPNEPAKRFKINGRKCCPF